MAQALYRKWRPQTFDEVSGQEHVLHTLRNAIGSGRVAHAYLFSGPRGTGKTTIPTGMKLMIIKWIMNEIHAMKLNFKDFVILYRTNAQSRVLEDALRLSSVPYVIVGGVKFYQRKEIKDVLAYLKVLCE